MIFVISVILLESLTTAVSIISVSLMEANAKYLFLVVCHSFTVPYMYMAASRFAFATNVKSLRSSREHLRKLLKMEKSKQG